MTRVTPLVLILILLISLPVLGHDTWLVARRAKVAPGVKVRLDLTSGMTFPTLDYPVKPERVDAARCRLAGKTFEISERRASSKSLAFRALLTKVGVATLWVELEPRSLELTADQVKEYFEEINAPAALRESWLKSGGAKRWREIYIKHAKTFVRVGAAAADRSWAEPAGMTFEIVPEKDPTTLRAGDDFPVRVLKNGSPLANFSLGVVREGNTLIQFQTTDAAGRVTFRLARSGQWLLRGTELRPSTKPETEWESDFTTLTIAVQ